MSNHLETGTSSFLDRHALTRRLEGNLEVFLQDYGFKVLPFGHPVILRDNTWMRSRLKSIEYKANLSALMIKFSPDYIVLKEDDGRIFFMDAKASITPVFFGKQVERIKNHYARDNSLSQHDIGEIEREAWFSYNKFYKNVAIVAAVPYNPNLLLAEWVSKIKCMWCLKKAEEGNPIPWDCNNCPVFGDSREGFGVLVNEFAAGSGTPHTNIHLGTMRTLSEFLDNDFGINVEMGDYQLLLDDIKGWPLSKPKGRVTWGQYNGVIKKLKLKCPWLQFRIKDKILTSYKGYDSYLV